MLFSQEFLQLLDKCLECKKTTSRAMIFPQILKTKIFLFYVVVYIRKTRVCMYLMCRRIVDPPYAPPYADPAIDWTNQHGDFSARSTSGEHRPHTST